MAVDHDIGTTNPDGSAPPLEASDPMAQLRKMRDLKARIHHLTAGRDVLIRQALASGRSERQVGEAAGLTQSSIHQIKVKEAEGTSAGRSIKVVV